MAIQKTSLVDIVIERIKEYIVTNHLKPNDKLLSEKEFVESLQVSRTVVREALISLQTLGIVHIKPGGGVYVADTKLDSISNILKHHYDTNGVKIKELVEIREIIELGALRLIVEKNVAVDFQQLNDINESYYRAIMKKRETKEFDRLFHQELIKATANSTYFIFSEIINEYFMLTKLDLVEKEDALKNSYHQHKEIIHAIQKKDLPRAQRIMKEHFQPIRNFIIQMEENANETNRRI
ncbi:FCD domain-containing protein [Bacillus sp. FJAT-27251]|uniref:FadR/GntR family transcriptional regulator n=1 Tax=Bacillus sp. FJAT-27251 TaxID=1684142 RepID=UPI0006A7CB08|nr:FCD domain-containing protein [Bacillus sp. FJAT-27251]